MALGQYKIKVVPVLDTASLQKQLQQAGTSKAGNMSKAGATSGASFVSGFTRAVKERLKYSVANFLIYGTEAALKDIVSNVKELDAAQTELRKVSDLSGKSLEKYTDQAFQTGKAVAKTGTQMIQAATEFRKSGFNDSDSLKLAKVASMYQNVADVELTAGEAANFIVSQIKAFNMKASDAEHIIDAVNKVSNEYAVSSADIATNIGKASAAMATGNVTYEQSIGLMTAMTEITRSGTKAARGLVTIQSRFNQIVDESSSTGKKLLAFYSEHGIAVTDSEGQLRSFYDVASDLSKQWDTLSENEKRYFLNIQAGANQSQNLAALMRNFGTATDATNTALESQNSAAKENAKYLDSIEGHLSLLSTAWENLSHHLLDSDTFKNIIDIGTSIVNIIDKIVGALDKLPGKMGAIVGIAGVISALIGGKKLFNIATGLTNIGTAVEDAGKQAKGASSLFSLASKEFATWENFVPILVANLPLIAGGIAALGVAIAAIEWDKYFNFENSIKRLNGYEDKLKSVQSEIDALNEKRNSDKGLTNAEKTHLAVLEAEERSLERQIQLEQQRIQNAFKKDVSSTRGKRDEASGRTGPTQLLDYQDSRKKELELDNQILEKKEQIADAEKKAQYYRMQGDDQGVETWEAQAEVYTKQLDTMYEKYVKLDAEAAEASANLGAYWEQVSSNVDYDSLSDVDKEKFDEIHKAFIESQIDASNLKDSYADVASVINSAMDSLGHDNLDLFDDIDMSSIGTVEDAINAIKEQIQGLDKDTEITFKIKNADGEIKEVTKKVSELTDEDYEAIIHFNETGVGEVDAEADDAARTRDSVVKVSQEGAQVVSGIVDDASKDRDTTVHVGQQGASDVQSTIDGIKGKDVQINIFKTVWESVKKLFAKGKRKGEPGGMAWLGDEGTASNPKPELVVGEDGAYLAGTKGWELYNVKDSDTVYTYAETKKLLSGKQGLVDSDEGLPRFAKGKKKKKSSGKSSSKSSGSSKKTSVKKSQGLKTPSKKKKKARKKKQSKVKAKKSDSKKTKQKKKAKREKWEKQFDNALDKLKHKAKVNHWSDKKFQQEYNKLYNKHYAKATKEQLWEYEEAEADYLNDVAMDAFEDRIEDITPENLQAFKDEVNNSADISDDDRKELIEKAEEVAHKVGHDRAEKDFDRRTGIIAATGQGVAGLVNDIQSNQYLTAEEKKDAMAKAYQTSVEYNLKEYKNGKDTRNQILQDIQNYYATRGEYDEDYYNMLDDLREADKERELKRLKELTTKEENRLSYLKKYAQHQKDYYDKQAEAEKKEADELEKLVELQEKLNNAKKTMVRVYREGVGFVYEQDTKAVREAQKALEDYNKEREKTDNEKKADEWQAVLDLFENLEFESEMKELALALGINNITDLTNGDIGTDLNKWGNIIRLALIGKASYEDLSKILDEANGADIDALLGDVLSGGAHQISDSKIAEILAKHSFANGTLSSPSGFSIVGEHGYELGWLNRGSTILPHSVSKNLLEWGAYSPAQMLNGTLGANQVFNFDKIVLPNVHNAEEFYKELKSLPNRALQQSALRT